MDVREGVITGTTPPQVRLDGSANSVPLAGWDVDPAPLYGLRVAVLVRPVPGKRTSEVRLLGPVKAGPQRAVWGQQASASINAAAKMPLSGLGTGALRHSVASNEVTVTDGGWCWISCWWRSDTDTGLVDRRPSLYVDGSAVAVDRRTGIDAGYAAGGTAEGTLTALEYLPIGGKVYVQAASNNGAANYRIDRLNITRLNA